MSFLLDTNVVSEWARPRPEPRVVEWMAGVDEDEVFMSVVSFAELRRGVELMPDGERRRRLATWISEDLSARFHGRVIGVDRRIADAWGELMARSTRVGRPLAAIDGFFAAAASCHDLTLVTRNVKDFESLDLRLYNPWEAG